MYLNLFPANQKTTWLSSLKIREKNNAEIEKLKVSFQRMDISGYVSNTKFVIFVIFNKKTRGIAKKVMFPRGNVGGKKVLNMKLTLRFVYYRKRGSASYYCA